MAALGWTADGPWLDPVAFDFALSLACARRSPAVFQRCQPRRAEFDPVRLPSDVPLALMCKVITVQAQIGS